MVVTNVFNTASRALLMLAADVYHIVKVQKMECCPTPQTRMRILSAGCIQTRAG